VSRPMGAKKGIRKMSKNFLGKGAIKGDHRLVRIQSQEPRYSQKLKKERGLMTLGVGHGAMGGSNQNQDHTRQWQGKGGGQPEKIQKSLKKIPKGEKKPSPFMPKGDGGSWLRWSQGIKEEWAP